MGLIRVIDFETTGFESECEVVEMGWCDYDTEADKIIGPDSRLFRVDYMPPQACAVHHITAEDTQGAQPYTRHLFEQVMEDEGDCDVLCCHNLQFDSQWIYDPVWPMICTYKSALRLWPEAPGHSNQVLRYWLDEKEKLRLGNPKLALPPHRAQADAYVTAHILQAIMREGVTAKSMTGWAKQPALLPTCPIGKFRGKPWCDVEAGFLEWMLKQVDMEEDYKWNARRELERRRGGAQDSFHETGMASFNDTVCD